MRDLAPVTVQVLALAVPAAVARAVVVSAAEVRVEEVVAVDLVDAAAAEVVAVEARGVEAIRTVVDPITAVMPASATDIARSRPYPVRSSRIWKTRRSMPRLFR